jgi:hypothetical protein
MKHSLAIAIALILAFSALSPAQAQDDPQGVIEGTVVTGTAGSDGTVNGLEATLIIWQHGSQTATNSDDPGTSENGGSAAAGGTTEQRTTLTDASGAFRFEGLPTGTDYVYVVAVNYASVDYLSDSVQVASDSPVATIELPVYETTTDASAIKVVLDHLAVQVNKDTQTIQVLNYVKLHNGGDRTLVAEGANTMTSQPAALYLPLPNGATNIAPMEGLTQENLSLTDNALADSTAFPPGDREVVVGYDLPYSSASYLLERGVTYPTDKLAVLMPVGTQLIDSAQLPNREEVEMQGTKYLVISGEGLAVGTPVQLALSGLPKADSGGIGADALRPLVVVIAVLALVGTLVYWRLRPRWATRTERSESV